MGFIGLHTHKIIFYRGEIMNQLNETMRILRIQIVAEEMQPRPDIPRLKKLRKELDDCLQNMKE